MARERIAGPLIVVALVAACHDRPAKPGSTAAGPPLASRAFYQVDPGPGPTCAIGTPCQVRLVLTALGGYHVNKDYPFKFVGDPDPALPLDDEGTFALDDASHGTLTISFRPTAPGRAKLAGTFKLSVCSDDTCEIETPRLELSVPVS